MAAPTSLRTPSGLTHGTHVAWPVDDTRSAQRAAVTYLQEGLARGERLFFVGDGAGGSAISGLPDIEGLVGRGQLRLQTVGEAYEPMTSGLVDRQVKRFLQEADQAAADGFTGIRVWADVTPLLVDAQLLPRFLDYELAIEETFRQRPATGLCAVDVTAAGPHWSRLATRHRARGEWDGDTPALAVDVYGNRVRLLGEIDFGTLAELEDSLLSIERLTRGRIVFDFGELKFLDVSGARALMRFVARLHAADRDAEVVEATGMPAHLLTVLNFPGYS